MRRGAGIDDAPRDRIALIESETLGVRPRLAIKDEDFARMWVAPSGAVRVIAVDAHDKGAVAHSRSIARVDYDRPRQLRILPDAVEQRLLLARSPIEIRTRSASGKAHLARFAGRDSDDVIRRCRPRVQPVNNYFRVEEVMDGDMNHRAFCNANRRTRDLGRSPLLGERLHRDARPRVILREPLRIHDVQLKVQLPVAQRPCGATIVVGGDPDRRVRARVSYRMSWRGNDGEKETAEQYG